MRESGSIEKKEE